MNKWYMKNTECACSSSAEGRKEIVRLSEELNTELMVTTDVIQALSDRMESFLARVPSGTVPATEPRICSCSYGDFFSESL